MCYLVFGRIDNGSHKMTAHLRSIGGQSEKVLWKAGIEGKLLSENDEKKNPKDVDDDETEIDEKDSCFKLFDRSFYDKGSRDI